jgi:hypothetical protein
MQEKSCETRGMARTKKSPLRQLADRIRPRHKVEHHLQNTKHKSSFSKAEVTLNWVAFLF